MWRPAKGLLPTGSQYPRQAVVMEEAVQCRMGGYVPACGAFGIDPPNIVFLGTPDQIERYALSAVETGEPTFVAITKPSGGSDPARAIQTKAVCDGDDYVLNGTKTWITSVDGAAWGIVYARTGPGEGRDGIKELTFHDLRGTAVTMLAEEQSSDAEIAAITDHKLSQVNSILDRYLARTKPLAESATIKFEAALTRAKWRQK